LELDTTKSTYPERSKQTTTFLEEQYGVDLTGGTRKDLENVVHLFSHIRQVYHIEWIRLPHQHAQVSATAQRKWVTMDELKRAPIPTGLKKAIKLLEKARTTTTTSNSKRKQASAKDIASFFQPKKKKV
jgi:A/G-specific adenine glycosylase